MVEYMVQRFGQDRVLALLERYAAGEREEEALPDALGVSRDRFFKDFLAWAAEEIRAWGLVPEPTLTELTDSVREADPDLALMMAASRQARLDAIVQRMALRVGSAAAPGDLPFTADQWPDLVRPPVEIKDEQLAEWRQTYPDHPDLLQEEIRRQIDARNGPDASLVPLLEKLAALRPLDLYAHRWLAQFYLGGADRAMALPDLEAIDAHEEKTPVYARQLAELYREAGDFDRALAKANRAVSMSPYDASLRELAAAIAVESKRLDAARLHVEALTLLEPDRPQHRKRLEKLDELIGNARRHEGT
jgi:tetratricopeptide (TPR) repeat protein